MSKLVYKKCVDCNSKVMTFSDHPLCNICIKTHCELSHMKDSMGRYSCNPVVGLVKREHCLCVGHYKMLQNYCYVCGSPKKDDTLSYDDYYYCHDHKPIDQCVMINKFLDPILPNDCIDLIISKIK